jgi:hypothetical protein
MSWPAVFYWAVTVPMGLFQRALAVVPPAYAALAWCCAEVVPALRNSLTALRSYCFYRVDNLSQQALRHGWLKAGMTCVLVAPQWAVYVLWRGGMGWWAAAPVAVHAVIFAASLPVRMRYRLPASCGAWLVLSLLDAPWPLCLACFLGVNLKITSFCYGKALRLLFKECRWFAENYFGQFTITEKSECSFKNVQVNRAWRIWKLDRVSFFFTMISMTVEECVVNPTSLAKTKILCFGYVFVPLLVVRTVTILAVEGLWFAAHTAAALVPLGALWAGPRTWSVLPAGVRLNFWARKRTAEEKQNFVDTMELLRQLDEFNKKYKKGKYRK